MTTEPLKGAIGCSPGREPWDKEINKNIKAPEGRKKCDLRIFTPLRGFPLSFQLVPEACAVGFILRAPFRGSP
jgi:hypothetical protein